jgi:eukaryotic-like serine/threonine-protein kinase
LSRDAVETAPEPRQTMGTTSSGVALDLDEHHRTRIYVKSVVALSLVLFAVVQAMGGNSDLKWLVWAGIAVAMLSSAVLWHQLRRYENYHPRLLAVGGLTMVLVAYCAVFYIGFFSPAPALFVLAIYHIGLANRASVARLVYVVCAAAQLGTAILISLSVVPDYGLIKASEMSARNQVLLQALLQALILCSYLIARQSRGGTQEKLSQLEQAVREVAQREALLQEARADLDRAMQVGGPGRLTDQIVGSYQLGNLIGRGGMGEVYEAVRTDGEGQAAVKLLHRDALADADQVTRFLREAEAGRQLESPHVAEVLEVGRTGGEIPYIAMELMRGRDLAEHLRDRRRFSVHDLVKLLEEVGSALECAREAGVVHRDIKPQNLFLAERAGEDPIWKVLDFGVSKVADHGGTLTQGNIVGTPSYMAPEQARGETVDHRTDLYALGVVAYRCLTGRPAFTGDELASALWSVIHEMPARPSSLAPGLHRDVDLVLAVALAKDPEHRFGSGSELARALESAHAGELPGELRKRAQEILDQLPWSAG